MKKHMAVAGVLAGLTMLVSAKTGWAASNASSNLVIDMSSAPQSMDPQQVNDINTQRINYLMYDTLVTFAKSGFHIVPDLATSWKISPNGLIYTFDLRHGVHFHDGTIVNARSVQFTFDRMLDPKNPYYKLTGPFPLAQVYYGVVKSVRVLSPYTVQFQLKHKDAPFLTNLTNTAADIVSPTAVKKYGANSSQHDLGSGAFLLKKWTKGVQLTLKANPHYWKGVPKIHEITFRPVPDPLVRAADLMSGVADISLDISPDSIGQLKQHHFNVLELPNPHLWYVTLNASKPPFNNVKVRQAVNYAVNKKAIVNQILKGTALPATQPLSPVYPGYNKHLVGYPYNVKKAKQLLKQAGYPHGFTVNFLVPTSGSGMQSPVSMSTAIQGYLEAIGITAKIHEMDWGSYLTTAQSNKNRGPNAPYDMWALSWTNVTGDPDGTLNNLFNEKNMPLFNSGFYKNAQVSKLLDEAQVTLSEKKRSSLYSKASAIITKDAPMIFVDYGKQLAAESSSVHGFALHPSNMLNLSDVTLN